MSKTIKYAYRMTHIENIPHILKVGFVHRNSPLASSDYISIGDQSLINSRGQKQLQGRVLSDYIPFYFGNRSPMLFRIQTGYNVEKRHPQEIVYCVLKLENLVSSNLRFIFTDGHANSALTTIYSSEKLPQINEIISFNDVYAIQWSIESDTDLKRRKEAELLFIDDVPLDYISGYVVYNQAAKQQMLGYGVPEEKIVIKPEYYY
jgi:hypothetical protein